MVQNVSEMVHADRYCYYGNMSAVENNNFPTSAVNPHGPETLQLKDHTDEGIKWCLLFAKHLSGDFYDLSEHYEARKTAERERLQAEAKEKNPIRPDLLGISKHEVFYSPYGTMMEKDVMMMMGIPFVMTGGTGVGKTVFMQNLATKMNIAYGATNSHEGLRVEDLIGQYRPEPLEGGGFTLVWEDGEMSPFVRNGGLFNLEELTRSPQDMMSRLFSVTDGMNPTFPMPERGGVQEKVHDNWWFGSTANPVGAGYTTVALDRALKRRLAIIEVTENLCDEEKVLNGVFGNDTSFLEHFMRFITDCRRGPNTNVNTGEIIAAAKLMSRGLGVNRAVTMQIANKYEPEAARSISDLAEAHFGGSA